MNFFRNFLFKHLTIDGANYQMAAGTTDVNSEAVNTANYREVSFVMTLGVMAAASTVDAKIQGSADGSTGWTDLAGSAFTQAVNTDDDKMMGTTISVPSAYQYLRVATTRGDGGNSTIQSLHAILGGPRKKKLTQAVTAGQFIADPEFSLSPAAGTA